MREETYSFGGCHDVEVVVNSVGAGFSLWFPSPYPGTGRQDRLRFLFWWLLGLDPGSIGEGEA